MWNKERKKEDLFNSSRGYWNEVGIRMYVRRDEEQKSFFLVLLKMYCSIDDDHVYFTCVE